MNYYSGKPARLVTLEGDSPELGIWPILAKIGKFAVTGIKKRIRRKRKSRNLRRKRAAAKKVMEKRRAQEETLMIMQAQRQILKKKRKEKQLINIALPAAGIAAAMLLMGKDGK